MDDIKLSRRDTKEINTLIQTAITISGKIDLELAIDNCALINIETEKITKAKGIQIPDGKNIKDINEIGYKYMRIIEGETAKHQEMKDKISKECRRRIKTILKCKLSIGNVVICTNAGQCQ